MQRGEPGYEQARVGRVFNARRPDRFPAAVLLAADEDDVIAGVRLAAERGWTVLVRSGGHSWAVWSLRDDALLIDLGGMRDMAYEPASGVVSARPAVQGGLELAPYCDVFGLAPELSLRVDAIDLSIEMLIHPAFGYRVERLHRPGGPQ